MPIYKLIQEALHAYCTRKVKDKVEISSRKYDLFTQTTFFTVATTQSDDLLCVFSESYDPS